MEEELYYLYSENKSADQLHSYHEADLHLFFFTYAKCWFSHDVAHIMHGSTDVLRKLLVDAVLIPRIRDKIEQFQQIIESERNLIVINEVHLSHLLGKPTMWFPNRSDTNLPVQVQKRARSLKFLI